MSDLSVSRVACLGACVDEIRRGVRPESDCEPQGCVCLGMRECLCGCGCPNLAVQ